MRSPRGMGAVEPLHPAARACCACLQRQGQALSGGLPASLDPAR